MGETKKPNKILGRKPLGKQPLGRSRIRWEYNIKVDLSIGTLVVGLIDALNWLRILSNFGPCY
jgi:hypothetical protein